MLGIFVYVVLYLLTVMCLTPVGDYLVERNCERDFVDVWNEANDEEYKSNHKMYDEYESFKTFSKCMVRIAINGFVCILYYILWNL